MSVHLSLRQPPVPIATATENLSFLESNDARFRGSWSDVISAQTVCGFRYQPAILEYYKMLSAAGAVDSSFIVMSGDQPIAVAPLLIEKIGNHLQASIGNGGFLPHPLLHPKLGNRQKRAIENLVIEEIESRLHFHGVTRWRCEADVLSFGTDAMEGLAIARYNALDISMQSHVMDLTQEEDDMWEQIRQSSKSIINKGMKTYEFKVYDRSNYTPEVGERHRHLHHKAAGKITRPIATFEKMNSWIPEGCGLMFEQLYQGNTVQMILVAVGNGTASGASAADDPNFKPPVPLTHSMNWFTYKECKRLGIKYFDVGETPYRDTIYRIWTGKEKAIHDFKRGFGRQPMPAKQWIWFSDYAEEQRYLKERLAIYSEHLKDVSGDGLPSSWIDGRLEKLVTN